jgi:uncharacterized protein YbjT (DUF2867 family)
MTILLTGGTGKTGTPLADALHAAKLPFIIATRSGKAPAPYNAVTFDWNDPTTFENPFKADPNIDRVYIVGPIGVYEPLTLVRPFIDLARSKGVKRFVLLSASQVGPSDGADAILGAIHKYLIDIGVDYAVLRPTWFHGMSATSCLIVLIAELLSQRILAPVWPSPFAMGIRPFQLLRMGVFLSCPHLILPKKHSKR